MHRYCTWNSATQTIFYYVRHSETQSSSCFSPTVSPVSPPSSGSQTQIFCTHLSYTVSSPMPAKVTLRHPTCVSATLKCHLIERFKPELSLSKQPLFVFDVICFGLQRLNYVQVIFGFNIKKTQLEHGLDLYKLTKIITKTNAGLL